MNHNFDDPTDDFETPDAAKQPQADDPEDQNLYYENLKRNQKSQIELQREWNERYDADSSKKIFIKIKIYKQLTNFEILKF